MADKKVKTMSLSGNDYAKVADRLLQFRSDWPDSKIETVHVSSEDGKSVEFTSYIWKNKNQLLDLMKAGITDPIVLRSSADSNGSAQGNIGLKVKDYEKLETIANGRALANIGYAGSGEIASFEEMEEFNKFRSDQKQELIVEAILDIEAAQDIDALKSIFLGSQLQNEKDVVTAKNRRYAELTKPKDEESNDEDLS